MRKTKNEMNIKQKEEKQEKKRGKIKVHEAGSPRRKKRKVSFFRLDKFTAEEN